MARQLVGLEKQNLLDLYEKLVLIRLAEERLSQLFADGEVPGFIHLGIGQEAIAVGVGAALQPTDTVASTHRGHGHALAKGMAVEKFFLELMGRAEGICRGRGGSMHVADLSIGMLGANGIVGAGAPIALGSALAQDITGAGHIAVAFHGDGALAEGGFHETMNMAALWHLPLLLVCENNGWAEFSPTERQFVPRLVDLAKAFGIPAERIDGDDVEAVALAARRIVGDTRANGGPHVLECETHRVRGHFEGDPQKYRDPDEQAEIERHDPLARCAAKLRRRKVPARELATIQRRVAAVIEQAIAVARGGGAPDFEAALDDVYAP